MSGVPISARDPTDAESALIEAARAFEAGDAAKAAALWRGRAIPALEAEWPQPLGAAVTWGLELALLRLADPESVEAGRRAVNAWQAVERWLAEIDLPLAGGRSTPAHFRKHRRDPAIYRAVALAEHLRLAGAGRAVALNNHALALDAHGRADEVLALLRQAVSLRRQSFGWREAGLGGILANVAAVERQAGLDAGASEAARADVASDPVPVGSDRFLALAEGESELRCALLAAAQLVPILRRPAG